MLKSPATLSSKPLGLQRMAHASGIERKAKKQRFSLPVGRGLTRPRSRRVSLGFFRVRRETQNPLRKQDAPEKTRGTARRWRKVSGVACRVLFAFLFFSWGGCCCEDAKPCASPVR